jgi:hypothetical protein
MMEFWIEFMWLFVGEVFIIKMYLNEPAVNQNMPGI